MKKLLIAMLALITALSVSLAACDKQKDDTPIDDEPDDDDFIVRTEEPTDTTGTATGTGTTNNNPTLNGTQWVEKNDTVYVLIDCNIRSSATTSSTSIGVGRLGNSFQRVATNGQWDKISFEDGENGVAYISSKLLSTSKQRVTFVDKTSEEKVLHLKASGNAESPTQGNLRQFPTSEAESIGTITEIDTAKDENVLKLLAVSEDGTWAKVSYTGTLGSKTFTDQVCYITTSVISELSNSSGNTQLAG